MVDMREQFHIAVPRVQAWPLLRDPAVVAACLPGASLEGSDAPGAYRGAFTFRFGSTVAIFRGEANLGYDDSTQSCRIEARGIDGRGASRATAAFNLNTEAQGNATLVTLAGCYSVAGPLEAFASAGGVHLARALMGEFAQNIARAVAGHEVETASGTRLIGLAIRDWIKR